MIFSSMWQSDFKRNDQLYLGVPSSCSMNFNYWYRIAVNLYGEHLFGTGSFRQRPNVYRSEIVRLYFNFTIPVSRIYFFKFDLNVIIMTKLDVFMLYVNPFIQTVPCSSSEFLSQAKSCTKSGSAKLPELTSYECDRILN